MLPHSRASQRLSLWKSRCASRRNSLSISSLLHLSRCNISRCNSQCNRYNNRSSLCMCSQRRSPLRPRTLSQSPSSSQNRLLKNRSAKKR